MPILRIKDNEGNVYDIPAIKGEKGETGAPATFTSSEVTYQVGTSGKTVPTGEWSAGIPDVPQGQYLWTRKVTQFNTGDPITEYSVAYMGIDGGVLSNFDVKTYATEDELLLDVPGENTIGVVTSTAISKVVFAPTFKTNPIEGLLYVPTSTDGPLSVQMERYGNIYFNTLNLFNPKQYVGGSFVQQNARFYQDGQWKTFFSATIHVTYPAGFTCTATDGVTTLTAPDTSGAWDCVVPNAAVWTVTATDGTKSKSAAVTITTDGQAESAAVSYTVSLYDYGDSCDSVTGGWQAKQGSSWSDTGTFTKGETTLEVSIPSSSRGCGIWGGTTKLIDLTGYNRVCANVTAVSGTDGCEVAVLPKDTDWKWDSYVAKKYINTTGIHELDVSALDGLYYIAIGAHGHSMACSMTVNEVYLKC